MSTTALPVQPLASPTTELGVPHLRLSRKYFDLEDSCAQAQVADQLDAVPSAHLWERYLISLVIGVGMVTLLREGG